MRRPALIALGLCLAARVVLALGTETYPDEAYYLSWSTHPQLSYFDHPGLVAWGIALLGVRTSALFFGLATLFGVHRLALRVGADAEAALWATALFASTPAANLLGTIATPDAPLLCFWVWTLVALLGPEGWRRTVLTGALWGLAMLSKYNGILLGAPVLWVLWRRPLQVISVGLIALAVTSPTLIWNAQHDWEGFRFQFAHGLGGGGGWPTFLEFVGGQFGMAGPLLLVLIGAWLVRGPRKPPLGIATVLPVLFFGYASLRARGEANWSAAAWLSGAVGVALLARPRLKLAALWLNVVVVLGGVVVLVAPPKPAWGNPAIIKLHGWAALSRVKELGLPVYTARYQLSSLVSLHTGLPVTTRGGRRSQYDLWPQPHVPRGSDAVWIGEWWDAEPPPELAAKFERVEPIEWALDERQRAHHTFVGVRLVNALVDDP
ncbi:MAG: glycosyltransferase family 39 protein [Myxococcaceae bacterium]